MLSESGVPPRLARVRCASTPGLHFDSVAQGLSSVDCSFIYSHSFTEYLPCARHHALEMWDGRTPVLIEFAVWLGALSRGCHETSAESWVSVHFSGKGLQEWSGLSQVPG